MTIEKKNNIKRYFLACEPFVIDTMGFGGGRLFVVRVNEIYQLLCLVYWKHSYSLYCISFPQNYFRKIIINLGIIVTFHLSYLVYIFSFDVERITLLAEWQIYAGIWIITTVDSRRLINHLFYHKNLNKQQHILKIAFLTTYGLWKFDFYFKSF